MTETHFPCVLAAFEFPWKLLLLEEGVKIPSDLKGITLLFFNDDLSLREKCKSISAVIKEEIEVSRISMLPSTASAIAYFSNFVAPVCNAIAENVPVFVSNKKVRYQQGFLKIILPSVIREDLKSHAMLYYKDKKMIEASLLSKPRSRTVLIKEEPDNSLVLFDMPTLLNSSYIAINLYMGKDFIGIKTDIDIFMDREVRNFKNTLAILIKQDAIAERYVKIVDESGIAL